jgi:peptide/nickel transport system ATP-binding protein/oligopeptide transport system ATP-binding protein
MPLVSVRNLSTWFPVFGGVFRRRTGEIKAVDDVSFDIEPGQTVGLVGESGSGKTTIGRTLLKLTPATSGQALYEGRDILPMGEAEFRPLRKDMQMIFQDPFGSLNPRMTIGAILAEPLEIHFPQMTKDDRRARVAEFMGAPQASPENLPGFWTSVISSLLPVMLIGAATIGALLLVR